MRDLSLYQPQLVDPAVRPANILIRPMAPHDYVSVCKMTDRNRAAPPITPRELREFCRKQWTVAAVAEPYEGDLDSNATYKPIVGFMLHALFPDHFALCDLLIDRPYRRRGIGTLLARKITTRLAPSRRLAAIADVLETNLPAQLFFRSLGFRCVKTMRNAPMPDVYRFSLRHQESGA